MDNIEILTAMFIFAMLSNWKYPKFYILQAFWILSIGWFGATYMLGKSGIDLIYPIIIIVATIMVNVSYLQYSLKDKFR